METVPVIGHLQPYFKLHLYKRVIKTLKIQLDKKDKYKKINTKRNIWHIYFWSVSTKNGSYG